MTPLERVFLRDRHDETSSYDLFPNSKLFSVEYATVVTHISVHPRQHSHSIPSETFSSEFVTTTSHGSITESAESVVPTTTTNWNDDETSPQGTYSTPSTSAAPSSRRAGSESYSSALATTTTSSYPSHSSSPIPLSLEKDFRFPLIIFFATFIVVAILWSAITFCVQTHREKERQRRYSLFHNCEAQKGIAYSVEVEKFPPDSPQSFRSTNFGGPDLNMRDVDDLERGDETGILAPLPPRAAISGRHPGTRGVRYGRRPALASQKRYSDWRPSTFDEVTVTLLEPGSKSAFPINGRNKDGSPIDGPSNDPRKWTIANWVPGDLASACSTPSIEPFNADVPPGRKVEAASKSKYMGFPKRNKLRKKRKFYPKTKDCLDGDEWTNILDNPKNVPVMCTTPPSFHHLAIMRSLSPGGSGMSYYGSESVVGLALPGHSEDMSEVGGALKVPVKNDSLSKASSIYSCASGEQWKPPSSWRSRGMKDSSPYGGIYT